MAAATVSTILLQLTTITTGNAGEAWRLVTVAEQEVNRLESNFKAIQHVLAVAEVKQYLEEGLKPWLERFKQVSDDMEDVLDDWKAAIQEFQPADHDVETNTICFPKWKVCEPFDSCFSFCSQVVRRHEIATRIKKIDDKLRRIVDDRVNLNLNEGENIEHSKQLESTPYVDVSKLLGREEVQKAVMEILQSETSEKGGCIRTIAIAGMRGTGKTALAQLIYHDPIIGKHFDKRIWVCVSKCFDGKQIAQAIVEDLGVFPYKASLQALLSKIREKIKGKKCLLVLDDVRADPHQDWEPLIEAFKSGMVGSRILVTCCKETVPNNMEYFLFFHLKKLSDDICWNILFQKASAGRNEMHFRRFKDIGIEIAKKCHGLPLVAKTLGSILQDKLRRDEWEKVLNSKMWESDLITERIYASFLLSYCDLPPETRKCLLYCAIFPKDYEIGKDELIQHWMAQGYLNSHDSLGENCFRCLATHFFFQDFGEDEHRNKISWKMHSTVHDFVGFLTKCGFVTEEIVEGSTLNLSSKKPRHLRLVIEKCSSSPLSIDGTEKLHSLVAVSHGEDRTISDEALQKLLSRSKHLRLLEFDSFYLNLKAKEIACGIGNLIHLRCLSLKNCRGIKSLPEVSV